MRILLALLVSATFMVVGSSCVTKTECVGKCGSDDKAPATTSAADGGVASVLPPDKVVPSGIDPNRATPPPPAGAHKLLKKQ